jgi:hypothetical protein
MDSKSRFVLIYTTCSMVAFVTLTFLNTNDFGLYVSSFAILYFALRLIFNPKIRISIDLLGLALLAFFLYYLAGRILTILGR